MLRIPVGDLRSRGVIVFATRNLTIVHLGKQCKHWLSQIAIKFK